MNEIKIFLMGISITVLISLLVVGYMRPRLRKVLVDLCGNEERAEFWTVFSNVSLLLTPLLVAMHYQPMTGEGVSVFFEIINQLKWGLVGLLGSILIVGMIIKGYIPSVPVSDPSKGAQDQRPGV